MKVIESKITVPFVPENAIPRQSLMERLNLIFHRKLTVVCAPAGYGKTTLISQWIAINSRKIRAVWISFSEKDNYPLRFWKYFLEALNPVARSDLLDCLGSTDLLTEESLDQLIILLETEITGDVTLVMDDFQTITCELIHEQLAYLVDYLPAKIHLVIASRAPVPLPTVQLLIRNQLIELTKEDLKFTQGEAQTFLVQALGTEIPSNIVARLNAQAEGWVAGLQMATLSLRLQGKTDVENFLKGFSGKDRYVFDYLAGQVFAYQNDETRQFMLCTSILDQMCAPLCNSITGHNHGQEMLIKLEKENLFVTRVDDNAEWFCYHPLFSDFLQATLNQENPDNVAGLHQKAADWYCEQDLLESTIEHGLKAKNFDLVYRLLSQHESILWGRNDIATIRRLFGALPSGLIDSRPDICLTYAWRAAMTGDFLGMVPFIEEIERYCQTQELAGSDSGPEMLGAENDWRFSEDYFRSHIETLRAMNLLYQMCIPQALEVIEHSINRIPDGKGCRESALALINKGTILFWNGEGEPSRKAWQEAAVASRECGHHSIHVGSINSLGLLCARNGHLVEAELFYQQALEYEMDLGISVLSGNTRCNIGEIQLERNQLSMAEESIRAGVNLAESGEGFLDRINAYLACSRLEIALGNPDEARVCLRKAYKIANQGDIRLLQEQIKIQQACLWITQKNLKAASHLLDLSPLNDLVEPKEIIEQFLIAKSKLLIAKGQYSDAQELLENLYKQAEKENKGGILIEILILLARNFKEQKRRDIAYQKMLRALVLAQPEQYIRTFLNGGKSVADLLFSMAHTGSIPGMDDQIKEYITLILRSFDQSPDRPLHSNNSNVSFQPLIEPLSKRELEVLHLINRGLSYEEIAQNLVVALSTIQFHVKHIYQKLNVHSGVQAVSVASDLRLL